MSTPIHLNPHAVELGSRALAEMAQLASSLVYAALLTNDGFQIVARDRPGVDGGRFASMSSSTQALGDAVARELRIGANKYVVVAADDGHLIQRRVPGHPVVLAAQFDLRETLGKALSITRVSAERIAELFDEEES